MAAPLSKKIQYKSNNRSNKIQSTKKIPIKKTKSIKQLNFALTKVK